MKMRYLGQVSVVRAFWGEGHPKLPTASRPSIHSYIFSRVDCYDRGCEDSMCGAYEYRADAYLKLHDYSHAISDLSHAIRNFLAGTIYGFSIDQFRRVYPEY